MLKKVTAIFTVSMAWTMVMMILSVPPARGEDGKTLTFGMSAAFAGANKEMGIEFYRGIMAYVNYFNQQNMANGWTIRIRTTDDGYNPGPCFDNTVRFVQNDNVFALFGYIGTPTSTHILPLLQRFADKHLYLLFPLSGGSPLRNPPFGQYVFNFRASYFQETTALVSRLVSVGRTRIGVFYQNDAYGRTGWDGVRRALKRNGLSMASDAGYARGTPYSHDFTEEVRIIMDAKPDAIIGVGTYASQAAFIRDLRNAGFRDIPVAGLSASDSDKLLELLRREESATGTSYTDRLITSQVVPSYEDLSHPVVRLYRKLMPGADVKLPEDVGAYVPREYGYLSFEGFLNAVLLGEIVKNMADGPRRERIPEALAAVTAADIGLAAPLNFVHRQQASDAVYLTTVEDGAFRPVTDWSGWAK